MGSQGLVEMERRTSVHCLLTTAVILISSDLLLLPLLGQPTNSSSGLVHSNSTWQSLWSFHTCEFLRECIAGPALSLSFSQDINSLDVSPNDKLVVSGSQDRTAKVVNAFCFMLEPFSHLTWLTCEFCGVCAGHLLVVVAGVRRKPVGDI